MNTDELKFITDLIEMKGSRKEHLLELLQAVQARYGYLPDHILEQLCERTEITPSEIMGVSTFYDMFRHSPAGQYSIHVCVGTACHVKGADNVYDAFKRYLKIDAADDTDSQRLFTVEKVACLGCCTLAPAVQIDQVTYGHVTPDKVPGVVQDFLLHQQRKKKQDKTKSVVKSSYIGQIRIGLGSCCIARGSGRIRQVLEDLLDTTQIAAEIKQVGCVGMCSQTPLLEIVLPDQQTFLYTKVQPQDVKPIVLNHFKPPGLFRKITHHSSMFLDRLLTDTLTSKVERYPVDVRDPVVTDFLSSQKHIATEYCGIIDPIDIQQYCSKGGFQSLERVLQVQRPLDVIEIMKMSGLRGRGGAGYPTWLKWSAVSSAPDSQKYIICNGDEGDPGAFMDRMLMESYPYRVIEGMAIAAFAVGASKGYFYIRAEYPLAIQRITEAISRCKECGYLGLNILGSDFSLDLKIVPGAGAFVCGEETALLKSIEGRRGMPHLRPPYPAQRGLWNQPTLINNVETYAAVSWIVNHGPQAYHKLGSESSKGTKVFALAGKVARGGLIEVPMGITIRQIVEQIGGGIAQGLNFKAVQVGGPSGGCIPAQLSDIQVDYESLNHAGAIMGSGGLVVLDETDCMVDIARYFLQFTQNQSCGKCTFCRIGTLRMLDILNRLCNGQGQPGDIDQLIELACLIQRTSLCGLGKTAPNPVLSTIMHFRDEYQAHIEGRCPAGKCRAIITYTITDQCIGCTLCAQHCPTGAIRAVPWQEHEIDQEKCVKCNTCKSICPQQGAVYVE